MKCSPPARALLLLLGFVAFFVAAPARAAAPGRAVLRSAQGNVVELFLSPDGEAMSGDFFIRNEGGSPLDVSRVAVRTSAGDPRTPPGLTVELPGVRLGSNVRIPPGQERRAVVKWRFEAARAKQLYGQILVESDTRAVGLDEPGRPLAIGIHAERPLRLGPFGEHALSFVVFFPLLSALFALVLRLLRRDTPRFLAAASALVHCANLAFVAALCFRFDRHFGRADGNDGYQLIERGAFFPSFGVEYFLGVDGISIALVLGTTLLAFVAALASFSLRARPASFHILAGLFVTSALGALVSLDLFLFCAFWLLGLVPACLLVARPGGARPRRAAFRLLVASLAGGALLCSAAYWLHGNADPTYLASGEPALRSAAIPELGRVGWVGKGLVLFGASAVKVVWVALFSAFMLRLCAFPFPGFSADVHAEADGPTSVLLSGILLATGIYGVLRVCVGILPDATRWAATTVAILGVATIFVSAFAALAESDMKRFLARISGSHAGFALLGIGSATPQGFQASIVVGATSGVIVGLLFLLAAMLEERVRERDIGRFGGLAAEMPLFATLFGLAMLASLGLPSLAGFWGPMLALFGAFARYRGIAFVAALGAVVLAGVHLFALGHVLFGDVPGEWRKSKHLEPFGGKFPEIRLKELAVVLPFVVVVIVLGVAPRPLLELMDTSCLEIHRHVDRPGPSQIS